MSVKNFVQLTSTANIQLGENSQIRIQVTAVDGNRCNAFMSISKWARYLTRAEKAMNMDMDNAPYRPSVDEKPIVFPIEASEEIAEAINNLKLEFLDNG